MIAHLENRVPPPLVLLITLVLMYGLALLDPYSINADTTLKSGAVLMALLGFTCMLSGAYSFRQAKTTVNPLRPDKASSLVRSGMFRYTRNPMYLGMLLIALGWMLYLASALSALGVIAFAVYIQRLQILPEERAMQALFGAEFADYKASTRRWL
ncbi:MAG: isoprenylcysteine carboxylmethyltransferase family protein [Pseudomonadota bacterium]